MSEAFYRPKTIDDLVGLKSIKDMIKYDIKGSKLLKQNLPSYCITGPSGTGKSTIAGIIAESADGDTHKILGSELKKDSDIYTMANVVKDNDAIYIEEAHTIAKSPQAVLLEWIENHKLLGGDNGGMDAPKVSFIFPTTNLGKISKPLRERCTILYTSYYSVGDIEQILIKNADSFGIDLVSDPEALKMLARCSRGTPRTAVMHRMNMLRKVMIVDDLPYSLDTVKKTLEINKINEWGLELNDMRYCDVLYNSIVRNANRPVSKLIMRQSTGFDEDVIDNVIEPYLQQIGAITVQSGGRMITDMGCNIIDVEPIDHDNKPGQHLGSIALMSRASAIKSIDIDVLSKMLEDPSVLKGGMKEVASRLGFSYPKDIPVIRMSLLQLGYTSRRHAGIVPLS